MLFPLWRAPESANEHGDNDVLPENRHLHAALDLQVQYTIAGYQQYESHLVLYTPQESSQEKVLFTFTAKNRSPSRVEAYTSDSAI